MYTLPYSIPSDMTTSKAIGIDPGTTEWYVFL